MHRWLLLASALSLLVAPISRALTGDENQIALRAEFQRSYLAASTSDTIASADSEALRGYILYPYLQLARLQRALAANTDGSTSVDRDAEEFLKAHDKEPVGAELRRTWYPNLAKRQQWERLLANYRDINDPVVHCYTLAGRVALQRIENLQSLVATAWSTAAESRPACEAPFDWLKSQGALTPALIESRARLALRAGNAAFARQMSVLLPQEIAEPLDNWATLIERPRNAIDAAIANPKKTIEPAALLDGWTRLVRSDTNGAMERFDKLVNARSLGNELASRYALEIALVLSWNRRPEALTYFAKVRPEDLDDRAAEWYARAALWSGDWKRVARIVETMSSTLRQQTKWRYWAARAAEQRGKREAARNQYNALLKDDNYYAVLAAARLKKSYTPQPQPLNVNEEQLQTLALQPPFARAHELLQLGNRDLRTFAYNEWRSGYSQVATNIRPQTVALAARWGWYDQSILTGAQQSLFGDYELLYPHPFDSEVNAAADVLKIPATLIYATLRQESVYRVDAQSSAGALGLMQLTPETARNIARRLRDTSLAHDPKDLFDAASNISLGAARLRGVLNQFDGNLVLALAAYNSGPGTAKRWLTNTKRDSDVWVENIPYNETRIYVQRVLWHSVVFGWLATHEEQNAEAWLADVEPKGN